MTMEEIEEKRVAVNLVYETAKKIRELLDLIEDDDDREKCLELVSEDA